MNEEPTSQEAGSAAGESDPDADIGNVPIVLIWAFVLILLWGIFSWIPFFK